MGTTLHHQVAFSAIDPAENPRFVGFVDACFGRPAGSSLRQDFPTSLAVDNHRHQFVGRVGGQWACAASALIRRWRTSAGPVEVAAVGCFATDPRWRGQGLSARLQDFVLERLRREGVDWAVLWTDRPEYYRGRGFASAGQEWHALLRGFEAPPWPPGVTWRIGGPEDAAAVHALYLQHALRSERTLGDTAAHLRPGTTRLFVAEDASGVCAYACVGKGADFGGFVLEYGGPVELVHSLWAVAAADGAQQVLVPEGAASFATGAAADLPALRKAAAWVLDLSRRVDPRAAAWAVWGFDSA